MTVTFKAVVIPGNKHHDGTYPVKIRVTFQGKVRRLPTTLAAAQADLTRQLKIKSPTILNKTADLIARMRSALGGISVFQLEDMDVDDIVARIRDTRPRGHTFPRSPRSPGSSARERAI